MSDPRPSKNLVADLREWARAWGVAADTPDEDVINETNMARSCARAANEIERLRGVLPVLPPRPPHGDGLPRFGIRWNGPGEPLAVLMDDGYWTPWHLAEKLRSTDEPFPKLVAAAKRWASFQEEDSLKDQQTDQELYREAIRARIDLIAEVEDIADLPAGSLNTRASQPPRECIDCRELVTALASAVRIANEAREYHDRDQDMRVMKILLALSGNLPKWRADTDRIHDVLRRHSETKCEGRT